MVTLRKPHLFPYMKQAMKEFEELEWHSWRDPATNNPDPNRTPAWVTSLFIQPLDAAASDLGDPPGGFEPSSLGDGE
jgi:hypothetical protein